MTAFRLRPAVEADVAAIRAIDAANAGTAPAVSNEAGLDAYYRFLMSAGRFTVAVARDEVVAFGATIESARSTHLADLFVRPDHHGEGIGEAILADVFGDAGLRTTFSSDDPRAMPLYIRAGMLPLTPNLLLAGDATRLPPSALQTEPVAPHVVGELERDWYGLDRPATHAFFGRQPGARSFVIRDDSGPVAAVHARDRFRGEGRALDNGFIRPGADPLVPTLEMTRAAAADARGSIVVPILGPNPAVAALVDKGFRIVDGDTFMASDPSLIDPLRILPNTGLL